MRRRLRIAISAGLALVLGLSLAADARQQPSLRAIYSQPAADWPAPHLDPGVSDAELAPMPPSVVDPLLADLGRALFHDRKLSASGGLSCAHCHQPAHGFAEPRASVPDIGRNTPTLYGITRRQSWGWDGRHSRLQDAILAPLTHPAEMGNADLAQVLDRAGSRHRDRMQRAFGSDAVTAPRIAQAIAAWLAQTDRPNRLDHFLSGQTAALTDLELRGLHLFRTKARCLNCHSGPLLSDHRFHNLRLSAFGEMSQDLGRWEATGQPDDAGRFRTPTLRGIGSTAPYMHSGHFNSLSGVMRLYARGGGEVRARNAAEAARPLFAEAASLSPLIRPLDLTEYEIAALVAFLGAL